MANYLSPEVLLSSLVTYFSEALRRGTVKLTQSSGDGRNDSSQDELKVSQALQLYAQANEHFVRHGIRIELGPPRYWYDFLIVSENHRIWLPVNVKVTSMRGQDNISSKEGLFYALTGTNPADAALNTWPRYCNLLAQRLNPRSDADYYFFVVSKRNVGHVFWNSLKRLTVVVPNGNNPPFQANWERNQERVERNPSEAAHMLMRALGETFKLRADAFLAFQEYLTPLAGKLGE